MNVPANPKEFYGQCMFEIDDWDSPDWEFLSQDTREQYIIEYDKLFVYNEPPSGRCGDPEVSSS